MNPELPPVRPSPEMPPQIPGGVEYFPDGTTNTPEKLPTYERLPGGVEQGPAPVRAPMPPVGQTPPQPAPAPTDSATGLAGGAPVIAADDDLMEKEWVDKVKKIIALTKGNPYEQAKAIGALQKDYLKKRYNRVIGEAESQKMV